MNTKDHFYDDNALYPDAAWAKALQDNYCYDDRFDWGIRQSDAACAMKRLLFDPAGIELYVENRSSALWPRIPEAPSSLFAAEQRERCA